jgi:hypothetical protein
MRIKMKNNRLFAILILMALFVGCNEFVITTEPDFDVFERPVADWSLDSVDINGNGTYDRYTLRLFLDGQLEQEIVAEGGSSVQTLFDQYSTISKYMNITYDIMEDAEGNRIIPDVCETGGSIITVRMQSLPENAPFVRPESQKSAVIGNVRTCQTVKDTSSPITSVQFDGFDSDGNAVISITATRPTSGVVEYGLSPTAPFPFRGIMEPSFNYTDHTLRAGNVVPLQPATTYYARVVVRTQEGYTFFSDIVSFTTP